MSDYAVVNPATGQTLATYPTATDAEVEAAIAAADAAYRDWGRATSPAERADWQWVTGLGAALPENPGLGGVAAYLRESGWFIGNESGIGHLASATGIPVLTLTGRMKRTRAWRPAWSHSRIVAPWYIPGGRLRDRYWRRLLTPQHVMWAFGKLRSDTAAATDTNIDTDRNVKEAV